MVVALVAFMTVLAAAFLASFNNDVLTVSKSNVNAVRPITKLNWLGHWLNEHDREILVKDMAKEFAVRNPDIELNLNFPQNIIGFKNKRDSAKMYVEMIKNNKFDWDVIWLDDQIYQFVADELNDHDWGKKYLVDFGQVPGFAQTQKDFIFNDPIWAAQTGGIIVGPMLEGYYHSIFYNKEIADQIGIKVKDMGMTFDDLVEYVKAVYEYNQKTGSNIAAFFESGDWTCQEILFQRLLKSEIGDFAKSLELSGSVEKNAAFKKTLNALEELGKYSPQDDNYKKNIWFNTRQYPLENKSLFFVNGIWMYNHWMSIDPEKTKKMLPAELPVFKNVDFYQGGFIPTWAVWKDAPNRDNGIKLMSFWSRPQVAEKWTRYTKAPTGIKGNVTTGVEGVHPFEIWQKKITEKYGGKVYYLSSTAYIFGQNGSNGLLLDKIKNEINKLLDGETTANAAYDRIMAVVVD